MPKVKKDKKQTSKKAKALPYIRKIKETKEAGKSTSGSFSKKEFLFIMAIIGGIALLILCRLNLLSLGD